MVALEWDKIGERVYETGVDHCVLYLPNNVGEYNEGYAWNGLTTVTQSPSGAESNKQYADNIPYLNLKSAEEFGATVEAFTYPEKFALCDGTAVINGVEISQQARRSFGMSYRSLVGNDVEGTDHGYKLHLIYGADANPSEKAHNTVNDSPEAITFSWELTTTPVAVPGTNPDTGKPFKPSARLTIDSRKVDADALAQLEEILYGSSAQDPRLPLPGEVLSLFSGTVVEVVAAAPTYNAGTDIVTVPSVTGVVYSVDGVDVPAGEFGPITDDVVVTAKAAAGYKLAANSDDDWVIEFS